MANRIYNYTAFYVDTPFSESNLGARATHDFCYYNTLKLWKATEATFPFLDAHEKTYNVRDDSSWDTLKKRLHERLNLSKNIVLVFSSITKNSRALREEIEYGVGVLGLPVIVIYSELENTDIATNGKLNTEALRPYWNKLPAFRDLVDSVPTFHVPCKKAYISSALKDPDVTIQHKKENIKYFYE